jgi:4,5-dihydroxyphthalate decarboxylase
LPAAFNIICIVVRELFRMIVESCAFEPAAITAALPPLGLKANRKGMKMAIVVSSQQKIIPRMKVDELFDDTTAALDV